MLSNRMNGQSGHDIRLMSMNLGGFYSQLREVSGFEFGGHEGILVVQAFAGTTVGDDVPGIAPSTAVEYSAMRGLFLVTVLSRACVEVIRTNEQRRSQDRCFRLSGAPRLWTNEQWRSQDRAF